MVPLYYIKHKITMFLKMAVMRRINSCLDILPCLVLLSVFFCVSSISHAADTLRAGEVMRDEEFLESPGQHFRLLFFSLHFSSNRYLGIQHMRYKEITIIWIANQDNPLMNSSGVLNITQDGNLVITDHKGTSFSVTSKQPVKSSNTSVTLLDSGNLVLRAGERIVWQSFDYFSDTFLPGMKLGLFDLKMRRPRNQVVTSWVSPQVPVPGAFTLGIDPNNTKQLVIWRGQVVYWRSGIWNGSNFSNLPHLEFSKFNFSYFSNENERYFTFTVNNSSLFPWIGMDSFGKINLVVATGDGGALWSQLVSCDDDTVERRSKGCVPPEPSRCRGGDAFSQIMGIMDTEWEYLDNVSLGLSDCRELCVRNCSCNAYASMQSDGRGCKFSQGQMIIRPDWQEDIVHIRNYTDGSQKYNTTVVEKDHLRKRPLWLILGVPLVSLIILTLVSKLCYLQWRSCCFQGKNEGTQEGISQNMELSSYRASTSMAAIDELGDAHKLELSVKKGHELPLFNFSSLEIATDYFSDANKLGQGGFGPVYKGKLVQGQEIAVKRLSRGSGQGSEEFKNEVVLISKLQHRNLVRLLGCCVQGEERLLIYEYLPNNSLDSFLFDATKRALLDWKNRVSIIEGIAQGLLYLHKYSRLRIIHRDLKTSNILLDSDMNPQISDFGTARILRKNESRANTNRIVGTYGYMSPEYAMDGLFSVKSDVFSFGVMMLEIICGKKNTSFYQPSRPLNLLGHAWDLYREGRCSELMDPTIEETCSRNEVLRYVQVGLLCVQESAADRPTMSDVASMLINELMILPTPKQPAFCTIVSVNVRNLPENPKPCSINEVSISEVEAR